MPKTLVVVESPAKAKTIKKYLGAGYEVMASKGHVRDLPKKMGIDIAHDFLETYEVIEAKEKVLSELKVAVKKADALMLATDPDREGEAIAWHIAEELGRPGLKVNRVEFHEITKRGVDNGVQHPRELDKDLYDAQRCRRVLDRLVGYDVSALVWSKLVVRIERRARPVRGAPSHRRARAGDRALRSRGVLERRRVAGRQGRASILRSPRPSQRRQDRDQRRRARRRGAGRPRECGVSRRGRHAARAAKERAAAVHDEQAPAGRRRATCASPPSAR